MAAHQQAYPDGYNQSYLQQPARFDSDPKASYDDLIDEYATPYSKSSQHKTYAVEPSNFDPTEHRRRPSFPQKPSYESSVKTTNTSPDLNVRAYPPVPVPVDVDPRGFWEKVLPDSMACKLYVLVVVLQTTVDLAIEGELLVRFHQQDGGDNQISSRKMPVYLSIFVLAHVFQLVMAIDAVYARNTLQFISLTVFNLLFLVYAIIQIGEIESSLKEMPSLGSESTIPIRVLTTIIPIVIAIAEVAYIGLGWKIYNEFGWKVYKYLGADRRIKKMFAHYQIFECLVKFDVFFWVGFSVQFIWLVLQNSDWEFYVTCAALPLSLILLIEGHLAARHENKWMMGTFMSGCVGAMIYFIYKLFRVFLNRNTDQFILIWKSLSTFSLIAIVLLLITFAFSIVVMRNFGRGLKDTLERKKTHQRFPSKGANHILGNTQLNRMSIN